jgi:hypothetical protein
MKILFPDGSPTKQEEAEMLEFALELRKRVKDQLYRIDETFDHVQFCLSEEGRQWVQVHTLEEDEWPEVTAPDEFDVAKQSSYLQQIKEAVESQGVDFSWDYDESGIHARHLCIDDRWDILLDRGLDIFQRFDSNDAFSLEAAMPEMRRVKQFEVTYLRAS